MNVIDKTVSSNITLGELHDSLAAAPDAAGEGGCILDARLRRQPGSLVGDVRPAPGYRRGRQTAHAGGQAHLGDRRRGAGRWRFIVRRRRAWRTAGSKWR